MDYLLLGIFFQWLGVTLARVTPLFLAVTSVLLSAVVSDNILDIYTKRCVVIYAAQKIFLNVFLSARYRVTRARMA